MVLRRLGEGAGRSGDMVGEIGDRLLVKEIIQFGL
jgi:hypothetical protein